MSAGRQMCGVRNRDFLALTTCLFIVGVWGWSYVASETCFWCRETWEISLSASRGRVAFYWVDPYNDEGSNYHVGFHHAHVRPAAGFDLYLPQGVGTNWAVFDRGGFSLVGGQWDELRHWSLVVPCWFLVVMLASLTTSRWLRATRRDPRSSTMPMFAMWLRPPRQQRPLPGMRNAVPERRLCRSESHISVIACRHIRKAIRN